jgi:hypothetical protein
MMAKNSIFVRTSGLVLLALALLALTALLVFSGAAPALAGTVDTTGPGCLYFVPVEGDVRIKVITRDTESGLAFIAVTAQKNLEGTDVPDFIIGTDELVVVTGDVADEGADARILVQSWDVAGNSSSCVGNYHAP